MALFNKKLEEEARERRVMYEQNPRELVRLIVECNVFDMISEGDADFRGKLERRNYALNRLFQIGVLQDKTLPELVDKLLGLDYTVKEE